MLGNGDIEFVEASRNAAIDTLGLAAVKRKLKENGEIFGMACREDTIFPFVAGDERYCDLHDSISQ